MDLEWVSLVFFFLVSEVCCKDMCKQVTTFDALCQKDDILYIVSANPCEKKNSISVTVINMKNASYYAHAVISSDTNDPIPILGHPGKGVIVIMHLLPPSDETRDYRKTKFHVQLNLVDVEEWRKTSRPGVRVIDVYFSMFFEQCSYTKPGNKPPPIKQHESCHHSHHLGEFSTLCIVLRNTTFKVSNHKVEPGIYITIADMCTVPYSTTIIALLFTGHKISQKFTQDKTDKYLSVSPESESKCGLAVEWHNHRDDYLHAMLKYGCSGENITLTDVIFTTHIGIMCPLSSCVSHSPLNQTCRVPWIISKGKNRTAVIRLTLKVCSSELRLGFDINVLHIKESVGFQDQTDIDYYHNFHKNNDPFHFEEKKVMVKGEKIPLNLALPQSLVGTSKNNDGYLYLDEGHIAFSYKHISIPVKTLHVMVLRYYPTISDDVGPLFHTEFYLGDVEKAKKKCAAKSDNSLTIGLTIALIAMLIFIIIVVLLVYRRRNLRRKGLGLPYQIHLSQSTQYVEMDDDLVGEIPDEYSPE